MVQIRGEPLFSSNSPSCKADNGEITLKVIIETAARTRPDGTPVPAKPLPKSLLWSVWQQIESVHSAALGGLRPAYDGRSAVYTNRQLPSSPLVVSLDFSLFPVVSTVSLLTESVFADLNRSKESQFPMERKEPSLLP